MICDRCIKETDRLCEVSMFTEGKDTKGIQNVATLAHLCSLCVFSLMRHEFVIPAPDNALSFDDTFSSVKMGKKK